MKFGKKLRATVNESDIEWRPMFMCYKTLKKRIVSHANDDAESKGLDEPDNEEIHFDPDSNPVQRVDVSRDVGVAETRNSDFFTFFRKEVDKVNDFFLDKQEDYIIEHYQLSAKLFELIQPGAATRTEINSLTHRLINFHAQLVLLENFSTVNYTGFRKILKKYDKKTGLTLCKFYLKTVLVTPFFLSDTVRQIINKTESQLAQLSEIRKFRRISPPTITFQPTPTQDSPAVANFQSTPLSPKPEPTAVISPTEPAQPLQPFSRDTPRPHAVVSPRSAMLRLYCDIRAYVSTFPSSAAVLESTNPFTPPPPPSSLMRLVDAIDPAELGVCDQFFQLVVQPSNYCIASEPNFSVGFFVLPPGVKLQLFNALEKGVVITRNLKGKASLRFFRTCTDESLSTTFSESDIVSSEGVSEKKAFVVEETRAGVTTGPWPAVSAYGRGNHVDWVPSTWCSIFYVCSPPLGTDMLSRFNVQPLTPPRWKVWQDENDSWPIVHIRC